MNTDKSIKLFEEAQKYIPGGVNSPVRAFKSVGGTPLFIYKGSGSKIFDVDGYEYIDYVSSWGPHLLGHDNIIIKEAISKAVENGTGFGAPSEIEVKVAKLISHLVPSVEMVRMVNSGTEATMSAIRLARAYTQRNKIIKFEGCYHGHADYFLIKAGSGALTLGTPTSPGVTKGNATDTLVAEYNNINSVKKYIQKNKDQVAAVIVEPVAGNMGLVKANKEFLSELRALCSNEKIVLIFDEVMTGFRLSKSGAQGIYGIEPDLSTFGKIIGGGLPVGAFGGKLEIMKLIAPLGPVYQAGTLSGNPLAMGAGYAVLKYIRDNPKLYSELEDKSKYLEDGIKENLRSTQKNYSLNRVGSMFCLFFTEKPVVDYQTAVSSDTKLYGKYFHKMLDRGIYLPPSQFETFFVSTAHTREDLNKTIKTNYDSLKSMLT